MDRSFIGEKINGIADSLTQHTPGHEEELKNLMTDPTQGHLNMVLSIAYLGAFNNQSKEVQVDRRSIERLTTLLQSPIQVRELALKIVKQFKNYDDSTNYEIIQSLTSHPNALRGVITNLEERDDFIDRVEAIRFSVENASKAMEAHSNELAQDYLNSIGDLTTSEAVIPIYPLEEMLKKMNRLTDEHKPTVKMLNNVFDKEYYNNLGERHVYTPKEALDFYNTLNKQQLLELNPPFFVDRDSNHLLDLFTQYYNWTIGFLTHFTKALEINDWKVIAMATKGLSQDFHGVPSNDRNSLNRILEEFYKNSSRFLLNYSDEMPLQWQWELAKIND